MRLLPGDATAWFEAGLKALQLLHGSLQLVAIIAGFLACFLTSFFFGEAIKTFVLRSWRVYEAYLKEELKVSYSKTSPGVFVLQQIALSAAGFYAGTYVESPIWRWSFAAIGPVVPMWLLQRGAKGQRDKLSMQVDPVLMSMSNNLNVNPSVEDAFNTIALRFPNPIRAEAELFVKQVRLGTDVEEALGEMGRRCKNRHFDFVLTTLAIGRKTGGNLPKLLERTAIVVREIMRIEGALHSQTHGSKNAIKLLLLMPFGMGYLLTRFDEHYLDELFYDPVGWVLLAIALVCEAAALLLARRILKVEV